MTSNNWKPGDKIIPPFSEMQSLDLSALSQREIYRLLISTVIPRPIAFVSSINENGLVNLAPFSFFNGVSSNPPCIVISIAPEPSGASKDTLHNITITSEFVVNSANEWIAEPLVYTAGEFPPNVSEMELSGLTPIPSVKVRPPRVKESAVQMECRLHSLHQIGDGAPGSSTLIVGQILLMHLAKEIFDEGRVNPAKLKPIARLGGISYTKLGERFEIAVPEVKAK